MVSSYNCFYMRFFSCGCTDEAGSRSDRLFRVVLYQSDKELVEVLHFIVAHRSLDVAQSDATVIGQEYVGTASGCSEEA